MLRLVLNVLWAVLGGFLVFLEYLLAGALLCLTVVGIPFGVQCFKLAGLALFPFGKDVVEARAGELGSGPGGFLLNVVWFVLAGVWIFLTHLGLAVGLAMSIIGLPFAWQHLKFGMVALAPFGKRVRLA